MTEHTPTPWALFNVNGTIAIKNPRAKRSHNEIVFWTGFDASHYPEQALANAEFIVKAVNNHQALVKALQFIADGYDNQDVNHVDFRVKVYQAATEALALISHEGSGPSVKKEREEASR